jgi:hypothetical protein
MLEVVEYIKQHGLDDLCQKHFITAKRHGKYNNLVLLKYDQINSDFNIKFVRQCRGIILDEANDWKVVCYSYEKFGNYGEGYAKKVDWETAKVQEKLDGSIIQLYYYDDKWQVASSGMPDAAGNTHGFDKTFSELFWNTWNELDLIDPNDHGVDKNNCYAFELMTKYNRVIVKHEKPRIVLHGARRLSDLRELNPVVEAHRYGWECVKSFPLDTIEAVVEAANQLDPMKSEGFVVCDGNYNRLKVKSVQYVSMSHLKESVGMSNRQLLEIVRRNESSEFLSYFEEFKDDYYGVKAQYERLLGKMEGFYEAIKHIEERKDFAALAKKVNYSDALFSMKYGKVSDFKHYIAELPIKSLEKMLGLKVEDET